MLSPRKKKKKKVPSNIGFRFIKVELFVLLLFLGVYRICISSSESFTKVSSSLLLERHKKEHSVLVPKSRERGE